MRYCHIKKMLTDYVADGGTVILSTHVVEVIEKICDRYIVLKNGKIIADLKPPANRKAWSWRRALWGC